MHCTSSYWQNIRSCRQCLQGSGALSTITPIWPMAMIPRFLTMQSPSGKMLPHFSSPKTTPATVPRLPEMSPYRVCVMGVSWFFFVQPCSYAYFIRFYCRSSVLGMFDKWFLCMSLVNLTILKIANNRNDTGVNGETVGYVVISCAVLC